MKLVYPAIFTLCLEKEGYTVVVPDLPGCVTEGDSLVHAIEMGIDAASGWVLGELEDGNSLPEPSEHNAIEVDANSFINLLVLDMDSYMEKYGSRSVRKNVTIPAWLDTYAEKHNVNYSRLLQEAIFNLTQNQ